MPKNNQALKKVLDKTAGKIIKQTTEPVPTSETKTESEPSKLKTKRSDREGKVHIAGYFPVEVKLQLQKLLIQRKFELNNIRIRQEDLIAEALNELFAKYNLPECAPISYKNT